MNNKATEQVAVGIVEVVEPSITANYIKEHHTKVQQLEVAETDTVRPGTIVIDSLDQVTLEVTAGNFAEDYMHL